ncbi:translational GTPase TypA [Actinopolyspora erythraea]|uniref:Large ribosomal subunit assembly factor BipA n=1 Tax=Actinopolyspora erythraea TaxID=414996 RepID=A0A099D0D7_9ACTN|nr:translational GTPase TypA [Actinopolyspora erythraea]ASU79805.1 translational GTPase TypA [Actinopolyspora erythraea]KGI79678.1 GTP-binding protein TypA [Actinopolyspora erythraea]
MSATSVASPNQRTRTDLRNIALVAHVDHGKTTLVDAMLRQSGAFSERTEPVDRVMDSNDLEREKGITILSKNTAIRRVTPEGAVTINVIDTPGHADFGGEVERGLSMVDGVMLLVDASEGPLPQTRFVLRKTLAAELPVILVVNKVDRPDSRVAEVVDETHELLLELAAEVGADESVLDIPVVYASARSGRSDLTAPALGEVPDNDLTPLFDTLLEHVPAPKGDPQAPLRALVTNLDASSFLGRIGMCRIHAGELRKGQTVGLCREDGTVEKVRLTELMVTENLERVNAEHASAGDLVAIAGIPDINIGDTLADPENPDPLPRITVDAPAISLTIGTNTSPTAGRNGGTKVTARLVKNRLDSELVGNVSLRVVDTERPDTWEVQGRGELALAVLVETMRREGFELTVGKPEVVTKTIDGRLHEPFERLSLDIPEEHLGAVTQLLATRKGRMETMDGHGTGRIKLDYVVPARGLIGFRTEFLTETRGAGIANHVFEGYHPWVGELRTRNSGSLVADRAGQVTTYALMQLSDRGTFFVEPGDEVYEGMVVGENPRPEDLDLNITKEKKLTNMRSAGSEELERLARPRKLGLEEALEFCSADECVEVGPKALRIRKVTLDGTQRGRERSRAKSRDSQG